MCLFVVRRLSSVQGLSRDRQLTPDRRVRSENGLSAQDILLTRWCRHSD
jgi:hypothetical protein